MTIPDHQTLAHATLRREGRHEYQVAVVLTPAGTLALARCWGPTGSPCGPALILEVAAPEQLVHAVEATLSRLHGRGYLAEDDVAPLLDASAFADALRRARTIDAQAVRALMWPDAATGPGDSIADALFG